MQHARACIFPSQKVGGREAGGEKKNKIVILKKKSLKKRWLGGGLCPGEKGISSSTTDHVLEGLCPMRQILAVVEEVCFGEARVAFLQQSGGEHLTPWLRGAQPALPQTQHARAPQVCIRHTLMPQPQS